MSDIKRKLKLDEVSDTEVQIKAEGLFVNVRLTYVGALTITVNKSDAEEDDNFCILDVPVLEADIVYPAVPYNMDKACDDFNASGGQRASPETLTYNECVRLDVIT